MNDVFISYAHIDDQPLAEGQRGWVSQLHRNLQVRLAQLLGYEPRIWRDAELEGSSVFDEEIVKQFQRTKVLVSVLTPRYVRSEWCCKELSAFKELLQQARKSQDSDKFRIFKVVKTPFDPDDVSPELNQLLSRLLGFYFYEVDPETGKIREYDGSFGPEARQRFFERIYDLAYEICQVLKRYEKGEGGRLERVQENGIGVGEEAGGERVVQPFRKTVFLGETTRELQNDRDKLRRELIAWGHNVLPGAPLPLNCEEMEEQVRADLQRSDWVIHLIGGRYGIIPEGAYESVVALQSKWAGEEAGKKAMGRIIWMPDDMTAQDERQAELIERLQEEPDRCQGTELVVGTLPSFKNLLFRRLAPQREPETPAKREAEGGPKNIYLICEPNDEEAIKPIEDYLFQQGFEVSLPEFDAEEAEISEMHRQHLTECDAALVYYGAARRSWVEIKLRELMKASGYGRSKSWAAKAVLVAPPIDSRKERFRTHLAEVLWQRGDWEPQVLDGFIETVKADPLREAG